MTRPPLRGNRLARAYPRRSDCGLDDCEHFATERGFGERLRACSQTGDEVVEHRDVTVGDVRGDRKRKRPPRLAHHLERLPVEVVDEDAAAGSEDLEAR